MSDQATARPWVAKDQGEGVRGKSLGICVAGPKGLPLFFLPRGTTGQANAELIVRAVNAHDALVEALTDAYWIACDTWSPARVERMRAAIVKATGAEPVEPEL